MINLFASQAAEFVLKNYLKAKEEDEKKRREAANDRLSIYNDDWDDLLDEKLKDQFSAKNYPKIKLQLNTTQNILKKVVNETSVIYKAAPTRDFGENETLTEIYDYLKIDELMKQVNRYGSLLNDVALRVGWEKGEGKEKGKITLNIHTPGNTSVMQNPANPEKADAVYYTIEYADSEFNTETRRVFWSADEHFLFDEKGNPLPPTEDNPDMKNPYGVIPFVFLHLRPIPDNFWNPSGGSDLVSGTMVTGMKRTLKDHSFKWQSFKQPYVVAGNSDKIPDEMAFDPTVMWRLIGPDASVGYLDLQADLAAMDETIKADMNAFLGTYGLSIDMFSASPDASSGKALMMKNRGLREIREEQLPYFRNFEAELYEMIRTVYNAYNGDAIPEIEFKVDFAEMDIYIDPMDKRTQADWDLKHGLISPAQFYMMFNPDVTDEDDAEKAIMENSAKLKDMQGKGVNLAKYFGGDDAEGNVTE
jgi:hypothetical protein